MMISDALIPILQEVYVAGIPEACVEQEFRDFFAQYGNVTSTKLSEQSKNGTSDLFWACVFLCHMLPNAPAPSKSHDVQWSGILNYFHLLSWCFLDFCYDMFWCLCPGKIRAWSCWQMPEYYKPCWTNVMTCRTIPSEMTTDGFGQRRINVKHLMVLHVKWDQLFHDIRQKPQVPSLSLNFVHPTCFKDGKQASIPCHIMAGQPTPPPSPPLRNNGLIRP